MRSLTCVLIAILTAAGFGSTLLGHWPDASGLVRSLILLALLIVAGITLFLGVILPFFIWRRK